jgi:ribosomal protein S18 acetylase RimI-like enzyme
MIKLLLPENAQKYKALRIKSLDTDPVSYLSVYENEKNISTNEIKYRLQYAIQPPVFGYYGYFLQDKLVAVAQIANSDFYKKRHLAFLYNVYTDPQLRKQGIATKLINTLTHKVRALNQYEYIHLWVNSENKNAISFYKKLGFTKISSVPKSVKEKNGSYQNELIYSLEL